MGIYAARFPYSKVVDDRPGALEQVSGLLDDVNRLRYQYQFDKSGHDLALLRPALERWIVLLAIVKESEEACRLFIRSGGLMSLHLYLHNFSQHPTIKKTLIELFYQIENNTSAFEPRPSDCISAEAANKENTELRKTEKSRTLILEFLGEPLSGRSQGRATQERFLQKSMQIGFMWYKTTMKKIFNSRIVE